MSYLKVVTLGTIWLFCTVKGSSRLALTLNITELAEEAEVFIDSSYILPVNNNRYFENQTSNDTLSFGTFDFIIVGGGAAGGVLANRLTEESFTVLLIEAGGEDPEVASVVGLLGYFTNSKWNWGFNTTPQANACFSKDQNECQYTRGQVLGGSTEINGAFYVRGNAKDYDLWEELGNVGWSYEDVLPYFKKSEYANFTEKVDSSYHGFDGLQSVDFPPEIFNLTSALSNGLQEVGLPEVDYNGVSQLGYGKTQTYLAYNRRACANYSFIRPARDRPNLFLSLDSLVTKVVIENNEAVAVLFIKDGQYYIANASKEVILSAGAVSSPQILMLSGIGPSSELKKHGIEVIADLPVGQNLVDHPVVFSAVNYPTYEVYYNSTIPESIELWSQKEGPVVAMSSFLAFIDLNNDTNPDAELMFFTAGSLTSGNFIVRNVAIAVQNNHPSSVGEITLASSDPRDFPLINPNFFGNQTDLEIMYQGVQLALELSKTSGFQSISPGYEVSAPDECNDSYDTLSREWWYCFFQYQASTDFHPVSTTRMGTSANNSVVNKDLKVHGIGRLRVVDAGVMPTLISGHTTAPTVMIAEKISDAIKQEYC